MADELTHGYAEALFNVVQAEGELDRVEDELYRFGKILESNHELKQALSDKSIDRDAADQGPGRAPGGQGLGHTFGLLTFIVAQGRARQLPKILTELSALAAEARQSRARRGPVRGASG